MYPPSSSRAPVSLVLYVHGASPSGARALRNLRRAVGRRRDVEIEVRDLGVDPRAREGDVVVLTPTLVRVAPAPRVVLTGELADLARVRALLIADAGSPDD